MRCRHAKAVLSVILFPAVFPAAVNAASAYIQHNLVSDIPGLADFTDPSLVDPWGVAYVFSSPFWITSHATGNATLYLGSGQPLPVAISIPLGNGGRSKPTAIAGNTSIAFPINGVASSFLIATEDGTISGARGIDTAKILVDNSASGAVYKGIALGQNSSGALLYVANFRSGLIEVYDGNLNPVSVTGGFQDPSLPAGFAPYNIAVLSGSVYVSYAQQDAGKLNEIVGTGNGFVNIFDQNGKLLKRLISNGPLNAPWGLALAPANWGAFGGALLVGNFGDGRINAFDRNSGAQLGTLADQNGNPIAIGGLRALTFGNGGEGGDPNTLFFTAGISNGDARIHGLFGSLSQSAAITGVVNAAGYQSGPVSPGEIVLIGGFSIGPPQIVTYHPPAFGTIATTLGDTAVTVNGIAAPIIYASSSATSVIVPYGVSGFSSADFVVTFRGQTTATFQVPVVFTAPGLFTFDASGKGRAAAIYPNGGENTPGLPASAGQVIILYGTGEGPTSPPGVDGGIAARVISEPIFPVSLTIGNKPAKVLYAGSAPGQVAGLLQVEAIIPDGLSTGNAEVILTVGPNSSQPGVTIAVK